MHKLGSRQQQLLALLEDDEWWSVNQLQQALEAEGLPPSTRNYHKVYMALRRLLKKGLVESYYPKTFGPEIRLWAKTNGSGA